MYTGASVSKEFTRRWRTKKHVAGSAPWGQVLVRRGRFQRTYHQGDWPNPQFGQILGQTMSYQWYPDWTPRQDWIELPGVAKIDLTQSFDQNGITVCTIDADNVAWQAATGPGGIYHTRQRGYLWPWRGYVPAHRPGSGETKNAFYNKLPNAQILVKQGYGPDTAVTTFTGLIDSMTASVRPDRMTIVARDFGSVLVDSEVFGWNKDKNIDCPITFAPPNWQKLIARRPTGAERYVIVKDAADVIKCALRWCGFKEWEVQDSGTTLKSFYTVTLGKTWADVINDMTAQLGYVFFIAEPSDDDSIGRPICRPSSSVNPSRSQPTTIRDSDLLTDLKPIHSNASDRYIIRVRGLPASRAKGGKPLAGDPARISFTYWPPWMSRMAGVIKQLTYYNIGDTAAVGFQTIQDCMVAAVLIAVQIALARDTATLQTPGNPGLGLDSFCYVIDSGTGVTSRLYITNRQSTMTLGGDGSGLASSGYSSGGAASNDLRWATELGGSLVDNPEWEHLASDYYKATHSQPVISSGTPY